MIRNLFSTLEGVTGGCLVILGIMLLGRTVYPPPADLDPTDLAALKAYMMTRPAGALFFNLAAYEAGSFAGGALGAHFGKARGTGVAAGVVLMAIVCVKLVQFPHPAWFTVASLALCVPLAWLGARTIKPSSP